MNLSEIYKSFFKNYSNFKGTATRKEFFVPFAINYSVMIFISVYFFAISLYVSNVRFQYLFAGLIVSVIFFVTIVPHLSSAWRRIHDAGYSAVFLLMLFVPLGFIFVFGLLCMPSQTENNPYLPKE